MTFLLSRLAELEDLSSILILATPTAQKDDQRYFGELQ